MRRAIGMLLLALVGFTACSKKKSEGAEAGVGGPLIDLEGTTVRVNGEPAGNTRAIEDLGRLQKIDDLFERLKQDRESFKAANPSTPFPGRATITAHPETTALVFKSMFQTAAFAGYPNLRVTIVGDVSRGPSDSVIVRAIIPGPPGDLSGPSRAIDLHVLETQVRLTEKRGSRSANYENFELPSTNSELRDRVKKSVVDLFLRSDLRAHPVIDLVVHAKNFTPHKQLSAVLRGAADAHERLAGPVDADGAFILRLAVN
jgi:hypothetical protein